MSQQFRLTTVLTLHGEYGEGAGTPLRVSQERKFAATDIEPTAKTVELPVSAFSTAFPLFPKGWDYSGVFIVLQNKTGTQRQVNPSEDEKRVDALADIVVGTETKNELLRIRSGCITCFEPAAGEQLYLYAPNFPAIVRISYFPIK